MRLLTVLVVVGVLALSACDQACSPPQSNNSNNRGNANSTPVAEASLLPDPKPLAPPDPNFKACNQYFPLVPGSTKKYALNYASSLKAEVKQIVDKTVQNGKPAFLETTRIEDTQGGMHKQEIKKTVYTCDGGKVGILSSSENNKTEADSTYVEIKYSDPADVMLEESAIKPGASWSYKLTESFQLPGGPLTPTNQSIEVDRSVSGTEDVTVPAGTFKAIKIQNTINKNLITEYYSLGIGLIKRVGSDGTTWELTEFSGLRESE